jgi:hypothetical protein
MLQLARGDVIEMLRREFPDQKIPDNAQVWMEVPGGGDWSNMQLDVEPGSPLNVAWVTTETKETP